MNSTAQTIITLTALTLANIACAVLLKRGDMYWPTEIPFMIFAFVYEAWPLLARKLSAPEPKKAME